MGRTYNVIDADGHVLEPVDSGTKYIDPAYRDRAPRLIVDTDGKERLLHRGQGARQPEGLRRHRRHRRAPGRRRRRRDEVRGGPRRAASIRTRASPTWISTASTPPSSIRASACSPARCRSPASPRAMCRAYNRWLADYCKPYPDRLFGVAMLPMQSIEPAIEEMRFARKELGMRGGFLRPNPYNGRMLHHPDYEPFWSEAEELDFAHRPARGRQRRHAAGRRRPLRDARRAAHHLAHDGDDAGRHERDLGRRVRPPSRSCASASWSRAAAGSRRGSTGWTATSTTRASTTPA